VSRIVEDFLISVDASQYVQVYLFLINIEIWVYPDRVELRGSLPTSSLTIVEHRDHCPSMRTLRFNLVILSGTIYSQTWSLEKASS
jgi:hypothetical protein